MAKKNVESLVSGINLHGVCQFVQVVSINNKSKAIKERCLKKSSDKPMRCIIV